jgi:hypothetical protein
MGDNNIISDLCRRCQEIRKTCESVIKLRDVMIGTRGLEIGDDNRQMKNHQAAKATEEFDQARADLLAKLDPNRTDSIQYVLGATVDKVTGPDGQLAKTLVDITTSLERLISDELDANQNAVINAIGDTRIAVERSQATKEALANTPVKGRTFEDETAERCRRWARDNDHEAHHIGVDNKPGDVLVILDPKTDNPQRIIIEAKDEDLRPGSKVVADKLNIAMVERKATAAVYLAKNGFAREIGSWEEGACSMGDWVACTEDDLFLAIRCLAVHRRRQQRAAEIKPELIQPLLENIKTSLLCLRNIKTNGTKMRGLLDDNDQEADKHRKVVNDAIDKIEELLLQRQ